MNKQNAPYLIHNEKGNVVINNYIDEDNPGFAAVEHMRPLVLEEMVEQKLPMPDEVSLIVAGRIELPEYFQDLSKGELNEFAVKNDLARSLNVSKPQKDLVHELQVMVAMRNKEIVDSTSFMPDLPDGFYGKSVAELKRLCAETGITDVSFNQRKNEIQQEIITALTNQKFAKTMEPLETQRTQIEMAQAGE